jgi:hypothetical protein
LMDACRDPRDPPRSRPVVNRALMAAMRRPSKIPRAALAERAAVVERLHSCASASFRHDVETSRRFLLLPNLPHFEIGALDLAARGRWRTRAWRGGSRFLITGARFECNGACWRACIPGRGLALFFERRRPVICESTGPSDHSGGSRSPVAPARREFASRREKRGRGPRLCRRRA